MGFKFKENWKVIDEESLITCSGEDSESCEDYNDSEYDDVEESSYINMI